jgi:hypothetical protein
MRERVANLFKIGKVIEVKSSMVFESAWSDLNLIMLFDKLQQNTIVKKRGRTWGFTKVCQSLVRDS